MKLKQGRRATDWRELHGLTAMLRLIEGRELDGEAQRNYTLMFPACEGCTTIQRFTDGSQLAVVTEYDAGYSELTPGEGAVVTYYWKDGEA